MDKELLKIENLTIGFPTKSGIHTVVDHVNLEVGKGEIVGIVGESGSGKSMTSLAVMGLLSEEAQVSEGSIQLNGQELLGMSREERRKIQGKNMSMVFQEPMTSLNPVMKIGTQVGESLKLHTDLDKEAIRGRVIEALASVGLRNPELLVDQYPHEISGGMRQRVMIAMAIINHPDLIIADEPTTALDVTVQAQILNLLKKIHRDMGSSILFISHDLNVIKEVCQKVVVMYKGVIVERGDAKEVLKHPKHEYTRKLVASMPDQVRKSQNTKKLLEVQDLNVYYKENKKLFSSKDKRKHIIHDMSFDLYEGEILGVVGESGCGKSTLAKTIVGLNREYDGKLEMDHLKPQMVFQDPMASLNPHKKILDTIAMGLDAHHPHMDQKERVERVSKMMEMVGLNPAYMNRYPNQFSGGQRQRIGLGRALIMNPKLVIADEAISALDVSIQAQVVNLMKDIQKETNVAYLFIAHDLSMVRYISDRVGVMHKGHIVETGLTEEIFEHPVHPYTKSLLSAIPIADPVIERNREPMVYQYEKSGLKYNDCVMVNVSETHQVLMEKKI